MIPPVVADVPRDNSVGIPVIESHKRSSGGVALVDIGADAPAPPGPTVVITRLPPTAVPGRTLSSADADAVSAGAPQYEVCAGLMERGENGDLSHRVTFSSSGAPATVTADADPSPFARCLMERSCQLRASSGPGGAIVTLRAVRTEPTPPPPPPPPPPPRPAPDIRVSFDVAEAEPNRGVIVNLARRCHAAAEPPHPTTMKLGVLQRPAAVSAGRRPGPSQGPRADPETLDFVPAFSTTVRLVSGTKTAFAKCVQDSLRAQTRALGRPFVVTIAVD